MNRALVTDTPGNAARLARKAETAAALARAASHQDPRPEHPGQLTARSRRGEQTMRQIIESHEPQVELGDREGSPELRRETPESAMQVRAADLQPYVGLRYLAKLFRLMALVLVVLMVAETIAGISMHGAAALVTIFSEAARLLVLAGVLWGSGDLAMLLIDIGHDVRATRILIGRRAAHEWHQHVRSTEATSDAER